MNLRQKKSVIVLLMCISLTLLAACGSGKTAQPSASGSQPATETPEVSQSASPDPAPEKVTLSLMVGGNNKFYETITKEYSKRNPHVTFDLQTVDGSQYDSLLRTRIATKNLPDIIGHNVSDMARRYNPADNFVDLSNEPWVARLVNPEIIKINGSIYNLPFAASGSALGIVYNKKMFADLNLSVPKTFEELLQVCETLKTNGITPFYLGNKDGWVAQIWGLTTFSEVIKGTDIMDKINSNQLKHADVPGFEEALGQVMQLFEKGYVNEDHLSVGFDGLGAAMNSGKAAMTVLGDFLEAGDKVGDYGIFATPGANQPDLTVGTVTGWFISKNSKNVEEAKKFLDFWSQPDIMSIQYAEDPRFSAFKDIEVNFNPLMQGEYDEYISQGKVVRQYNDLIAVDTSELFRLYQDMFGKGKTPKQVLKAWDEKVEELAKAAELPGW